MMIKVLDPTGNEYYITRFAVDLAQFGLTENDWMDIIRYPFTQETFRQGGIPVIGHRKPFMSIEEFTILQPEHIVGHVQNEPSLLVDPGSVKYGHTVKSAVTTVDVRWLPKDTTILTRTLYNDDATYPGALHLVPRLIGHERLICFDLITIKLAYVRDQSGMIETSRGHIIDPGLREQILKMNDKEIVEIMSMEPEEAKKRLGGYNQAIFSYAAGFIQSEINATIQK